MTCVLGCIWPRVAPTIDHALPIDRTEQLSHGVARHSVDAGALVDDAVSDAAAEAMVERLVVNGRAVDRHDGAERTGPIAKCEHLAVTLSRVFATQL